MSTKASTKTGEKNNKPFCKFYLNDDCTLENGHDGFVHPRKDDVPKIIEGMRKKPCIYGKECRSEICFHSHPEQPQNAQVPSATQTISSKKAVPALNPSSFPPLYQSSTSTHLGMAQKMQLATANPQSSLRTEDSHSRYSIISTSVPEIKKKEVVDGEFQSHALKFALEQKDILKKYHLSDKYWEVLEKCLDDVVTSVKLPTDISDVVLNQSETNADTPKIEIKDAVKFTASNKSFPNIIDLRDQNIKELPKLISEVKKLLAPIKLEYAWLITEKLENRLSIYRGLIEAEFDFMLAENRYFTAFRIKKSA